MPVIKFYDLATKDNFSTDEFRLTIKMNGKRKIYFAVAQAPSGNEAWRIVSKEFYKKNK